MKVLRDTKIMEQRYTSTHIQPKMDKLTCFKKSIIIFNDSWKFAFDSRPDITKMWY